MVVVLGGGGYVSGRAEIVAQVAKERVSILVVEQFARAVLGIVDWVGIMLRGRISNFGTPAAMEAELPTAYLGE